MKFITYERTLCCHHFVFLFITGKLTFQTMSIIKSNAKKKGFLLQSHSQKEGGGRHYSACWKWGVPLLYHQSQDHTVGSRKMTKKLLSAQNKCVINVVVVVFVDVFFYVIFVIVAYHCFRRRHRSVRPTDWRADHGSDGVVESAGGSILGWLKIHPHLLTSDGTDGQKGWTGGRSRRLEEMRSCI